MMLRKSLNIILGRQLTDVVLGSTPVISSSYQQKKLERELIYREAEVGGWVLGELPAGHSRSFFCLDTHTWIWNENWHDSAGQLITNHVQYDVRTDGILKRVNGGSPVRVTGQELQNFDHAVSQYYHHVSLKVYGRTVATA